MNKMNKILSTLFLITFFFTSCGSDKEEDRRIKYSFNGICRHSVDIKGYADQKILSQESVVLLDDLLKGYDYVSPIIGGELMMTELTSIKIKNLQSGIILNDFILTINDKEYKFGKITSETTNLYTNNTINYFKGAFSNMVNQRKLRVQMSYTPTKDIGDDALVKLEIVFNGRFTYKK